MMKKSIIVVITIGVILLGGAFFLQNVNTNRIGADEYFTQIEGPGKKIEGTFDNGEKYTDYEYELPAYNKDGKKEIFTFTAQKQLREKAYLDLYVKKGDGVVSWKEVKIDEIPEKAKEELR